MNFCVYNNKNPWSFTTRVLTRPLDLLAVAAVLLAGCVHQARPSPAPPVALQAPADRVEDPRVRATLQAGGIDPDRLLCNTRVHWETRLEAYAGEIAKGLATLWQVSPDQAAMKRARHHALGYLVRSSFEDTRLHNLGALALKGRTYADENGTRRPLLVFRSGLIFGQQGQGVSACFESLVREARVRHVLNLYTGTFPFRDLIAAERQAAARLGAGYFDAAEAPEANWRQEVEDEAAYRRNLPKVMAQIASLMRGQILQPGAQPPRGNIYFHCGGGMHRSGMVFALLRRCLNQDPMPLIEQEYKHHVGWISDAEPGGFESLNLRLVRDFDCSLLTRP